MDEKFDSRATIQVWSRQVEEVFATHPTVVKALAAAPRPESRTRASTLSILTLSL